MEFSKRLTDNARDVLASAELFARSNGSAYVGTEHLLLGILSQQSSIGSRVLTSAAVDLEKVKAALKLTATSPEVLLTPTKGFSETAKLTLRMSVDLAGEFHQDYCGTEHILFSLLNQKSSRAATTLIDLGVDIEAILSELEGYLERQHDDFHNAQEELAKGRPERQTRGSFLNKFSRDLIAAAKNQELDPVVGREKEVERLITILSRRTKNNPVLIGEAGVGKTAIVEGLAQKITSGEAPDHLLNKKVLQLDLAAMVAGTKYRGEFEERLKRVLDEVKFNRNLLIFIDELHLLMGAGSAEGAMDAANLLKPSLARGDFRLIGATTLDEYRKSVEKDAALTRRLQTIIVEPPNARDTEKVLKGLKEQYENHHNVKLTNKVITEAVRLSERYLPERQQPDKALDVIDEAAARLQIKNRTNGRPTELKDFTNELKNLTEKMEDAVSKEDYERAALYKMRISRLNEKIAEIEKSPTENGRPTLKLDDIAAAVSVMTGVPLEQLQRTEATKLANLEKHLSKKIIGQKRAINAVAQAIRRGRIGIADGKRPTGSFIFLGPTGVGKTELARVLAQEVFGSEKNLIKIDMSEFSEKHTASRLVGAPAGYVGYEDGGGLTEKIRRQPYSVVLFDEIEKAHPSIFNLLLQILEDGHLTDGHGRVVDFSNTVVILTSNIGTEKLVQEKLGFGSIVAETNESNLYLRATLSDGESVSGKPRNDGRLARRASKSLMSDNSMATKALRDLMRPELLNRFDAIITFDNLTHAEVSQILDLMIEDLNQRLASKGVAVVIGLTAKRWLLARGYDPKFGARPLRRTIQNELENLIAEGLIDRQYRKGDIIRASVKNNEITLNKLYEKNQTISTKLTKA
ncbi:ATP-dependent Clp protease ATP-binding subunit [Candidatus Saccharibacteria bacterium]|nr:ATP-dependent Clp protease ATP-binding subunit [Candidatus Saccharibacteria bacterium]